MLIVACCLLVVAEHSSSWFVQGLSLIVGRRSWALSLVAFVVAGWWAVVGTKFTVDSIVIHWKS
jgi:hypothetical protein